MTVELSGFKMERMAKSGKPRQLPGQQRINRVLGIAIVVFLVLVPIPLGSNRPVFWAINAAAIGACAVFYAIALMAQGHGMRFPVSQILIVTLCWLALCLFCAAQFFLPLETVFAGSRGFTVTSEALSLAPGASLHALVGFMALGVFFFLTLQAAGNRRRAMLIANAIFWAIALHAVYGLLALYQFGDTLLVFEKWAYPGSATGTFVNRNSYATLLAFGVVLGTALAIHPFAQNAQDGPRAWSVLVLQLVGLIFLISALYATQSRIALFATLAGSSAVVLGTALKCEAGGTRFALSAAASTVMLAGAGMFLFGSGTLVRMGDIERDFAVNIAFYEQVVSMIAQRPLLGYGGGSFEIAYPLFHDFPVNPARVWDKTQNTYLALWADYGLIFGSLPLVVVAIIAIQCLRLVIHRKSDWPLPLVALGTIATAATTSLVEFSLEIQANAFYFAAILALGLAGIRPDNKSGTGQ